MGLQIVIDAKEIGEATHALEAGGAACEIFPMPNDQVGISIPTRVFETVGDAAMTMILSSFSYIDLWSGDRCGKRSR
jgi:hypothetical protein